MVKVERPTIDIGLVCSDFEASLHFYRDILGLEIAAEVLVDDEGATKFGLAPRGFRHVRMRAGGTLIKLMEIENPPAARSFDFQAGIRWLTFILDDVPTVVAELKSKGVEFMAEPVSAPDAKHVVCAKGPDGMLIELVQLPDD